MNCSLGCPRGAGDDGRAIWEVQGAERQRRRWRKRRKKRCWGERTEKSGRLEVLMWVDTESSGQERVDAAPATILVLNQHLHHLCFLATALIKSFFWHFFGNKYFIFLTEMFFFVFLFVSQRKLDLFNRFVLLLETVLTVCKVLDSCTIKSHFYRLEMLFVDLLFSPWTFVDFTFFGHARSDPRTSRQGKSTSYITIPFTDLLFISDGRRQISLMILHFLFVPFYLVCGQTGVLSVQRRQTSSPQGHRFSQVFCPPRWKITLRLLKPRSSPGRSENLVGFWPWSPGFQHLSWLGMVRI